MIVDFTEEEIKRLNALNKNYDKLIKEQEELVLSLRPDDPEPDIDEYDRLQDSYPTPPAMPELEPNENGQYAYSVEAMDAYRESDEYKAYEAERDRIDQAIDKLYDDWYNAGSDEWKAASKRLDELVDEAIEADKELRAKIVEKHFAALGGDSALILKDAKSQVDRLIPLQYKELENRRSEGSVRSKRARVQDDGSFLLDTEEMNDYIIQELKEHIEALGSDRDTIRKLKRYIKTALQKSELVGDTGDLGGIISILQLPHEATEEKPTLAVRPQNYVTTKDKVTKKAFQNKLTKPENAKSDDYYTVSLNKKKTVIAHVSIDYNDLMKSGVLAKMPELNDDDYDVHDGIITQYCAGNRIMSYDMIYRAMTGKISGKVTVTEETEKMIDEALEKFNGRFKLKYTYKDKDGLIHEIKYDESIVTYARVKDVIRNEDGEIIDGDKINGKYIEKGIILPSDPKFMPPLLKWAMANGNELDTRDITLLDVKGLNNGEESRRLKMCLYRRLITMANEFKNEKNGKYELADNRRTIRYDYVYSALGIDFASMSGQQKKDKKKLIKDKIDRCMKYWESEAPDRKKLITGHEHIRDKSAAGSPFYAVKVSFMPQ